ncbi:MAG TPA: CinA family protein [Candidatus Binatia bacterium]|nr:CinA family protein [Candidatus Binatia bacterium]
MTRTKGADEANALIAAAKAKEYRLVTAESCTGGLVAAAITAIPGASAVLERGFVTYSNEAKTEMLGVPAELIERRGAVSQEVALAMVDGALKYSAADIAVAVTGIAGPDGGSEQKPVGLVHIAAARRDGPRLHEEHRFGDLGRNKVQAESAVAALRLIQKLLD